MHGRIKIRTTAEQSELKRLEREKKVKVYKSAIQNVFERRSAQMYDNDSLQSTTDLLLANPDIITLWNYRREILLHLKQAETEQDFRKYLETDLTLTEQCLRINPKSYGSWHHRVWVLDNFPRQDMLIWSKQKLLCDKYLELDERNFHCWDFRKIVSQRCCERTGLSKEMMHSEYVYTTEKINANFSNYSAWHLRSKLLPRLFPDENQKLPITEEKHKEELELVQNAAFTDPNDQSAWFYQRWLLGLTEPKIHFVVVYASLNSVTVTLSKCLRQNDTFESAVKLNILANDYSVVGEWKSLSGTLQSTVWVFTFVQQKKEADVLTVTLQQSGHILDKVIVNCLAVESRKPKFISLFSEALLQVLNDALSSFSELLELEPNSKWTLLTTVWLMNAISSAQFEDQIMFNLKCLTEIDPLREGYYADLASKFRTEHAILRFHDQGNGNGNLTFNLPDSKLTCLYHVQYLFLVEHVNLKGNKLTSDSLVHLYGLQKCKSLILDCNEIVSLKQLPNLAELEVLSLKGNQIAQCNSLSTLLSFPKLKKLALHDNPITKTQEWETTLSQFSALNLNDPR